MTASTHQQVLVKKDILDFWRITFCKQLTLTLARQI